MGKHKNPRDVPGYAKLREQAKQYYEWTCWICGHEIPKDVPPRSEWSWSMDHLEPVGLGGEAVPPIELVRPAHLRCNSLRGTGVRGASVAKRREAAARAEQQVSLVPATSGLSSRDLPSPQPAMAPEVPSSPQQVPEWAEELVSSGLRLPRLETRIPGNVAGTVGPEFTAWVRENLATELRPWQKYVANRFLETREDGRLRWRYGILTVPRQSGKSWFMRSLAAWRMFQAERFGEPQTVLHVASRRQLARVIWRGIAKHLDDSPDHDVFVRWANGQEAIELPDGSNWEIAAANVTGIPGLSVSLGLVDEAWTVDAEVIEAGLLPTLLARQQSQLLLVSTAGDHTSDLMLKYREAALGQAQDPDTADWLLLEWSASPDREYWDEDGWIEASPEWNPDRADQVRSAYRTLDEAAFAMQYLNLWVRSASGWVTEPLWDSCASAEPMPDAPGVVAVESAVNGLPVGWVRAVPGQGGKIHVEARQFEAYPDLFRELGDLCAANPGIEVLRHRALKLPPFRGSSEFLVGSTEQVTGYGRVRELVANGLLVHSDQQLLNEHVLVANTHSSPEGKEFLSQKRSGAPIFLARAMIWAVGRLLDPTTRKVRAKVVTG